MLNCKNSERCLHSARKKNFRRGNQISKVALAAPPAWFPLLAGWRGESAGCLCPPGQRTAGALEIWLPNKV